MNRTLFAKVLVVYLIPALLALSLPAQGWAMFLPAPLPDASADRSRIRTMMESSLIQQRLLDYGLSPEETMTKINALSDEQIHQLAANMDSLQAGGSIVGDVVFVLLVVLLVIVILELTGHHVVVRR